MTEGSDGPLDRAYRRLGSRYPRVVVAAVPQLALVNVVLGVLLLLLFVDVSAGELARILGAGLGGMALYNVVYTRAARRLLAPVDRWLGGARDRSTAIAAWESCAALPRVMMRREWSPGSLGGLGYTGLLVWSAYVAWQLDLSAQTGVALAAGIFVFILYLQALRFFALERALRPVLGDIARTVSDEVELSAPVLPLRTRLLVALPAINVITGVVAVGITGQGHNLELPDLGLAVVVSVFIAATISLALTLLLADSIAEPISDLQQATTRLSGGDFAVRVPIITTDETGVLAGSFNEMAAGLEQRERLREAFGTFVDPALTERVLEEGTDLEGEEVDLSLLFMDIRGFTSFSERTGAREVVALLNDLYGVVVPVILRHGGHANKFIGDGLLAVFGAPTRLPDHAERAVAAGAEIAEKVHERFGEALRVGIGVNSGPVVVGTIGGGGRLDFTVIGDAVNTAARVESATRQTGDTMLVTESTLLRLPEPLKADFEEREAIPLKGKSDRICLFAPGRF